MRSVAVLLQLSVTSATRDQFDELDARVGQAMSGVRYRAGPQDRCH
jgi:hypothetical protein